MTVIHLATRTANFTTDDDMYFPVSLRPFCAEYRDDMEEAQVADADKFRAVVREDTNEVLAVHGKGYKLARNEDIFPQFEDGLRMSNLDLTDMYTKVELNDNGASVVKTYHFPAHSVEINNYDAVDMQLRVRNSYDGRWAFSTILGGFRLLCSNGMTIGDTFMSTYGRHTKGLDVSESIKKVDNAAEIYLNHQEVWKHWANRAVTEGQVMTLLRDEMKFPEAYVSMITGLFMKEAQGMGPTIWALFNALTFWSTHGKAQKGAQSSVIQDNREKRIRTITNSSGFLRLAA